MVQPAVFLDRDGTLIEDAGYLGDPDQVRLLPGAPEGLARLRQAGFRLVLVSNQSGVARGLFDETALARVHDRLRSELARVGVTLDGAYYCPYLDGPEAVVERYRRDSELRKPKPGMLTQAARELALDLPRSWMVGNSPADVEAGRAAGCRTIRIAENAPSTGDAAHGCGWVARDLREAAKIILSEAP
jgi:D,D-heptose 1,7-bisphosphate phosphatase